VTACFDRARARRRPKSSPTRSFASEPKIAPFEPQQLQLGQLRVCSDFQFVSAALVQADLDVWSGRGRLERRERRSKGSPRQAPIHVRITRASNVATIYAPFTGANKRTPGSTQVSLMRKVRRSIQ
jgi:hypothetical protein